MALPDIYVSTDIETNGPIPGIHSMLSVGSAAFLEDKTLLSTFSANLEILPNITPDQKTADWWKTQVSAWQACRQSLQSPDIAMQAYCQWLEQLPGRILFVGYPVVFDFRFIDYYLYRFVGHNPFGYATIDIRSYVMGMRNVPFNKTGKRYFPNRWFDDLPHTHIALDDALEQGALFCNILIEQKKIKTLKNQEEK